MGIFKSLVDKVKDKSDELAKKTAEKAARKAAEVAMDRSAKAAKGALDSAGRVIEKAIFGDVVAEEDEESARARQAKEEAAPDPFAKVKAQEAAKKERAREETVRAKERAEREKKIDRDVDAELLALKKKLGK
jgi:hypothetical protein